MHIWIAQERSDWIVFWRAPSCCLKKWFQFCILLFWLGLKLAGFFISAFVSSIEVRSNSCFFSLNRRWRFVLSLTGFQCKQAMDPYGPPRKKAQTRSRRDERHQW